MKQPLVSIIIPVYNEENDIANCLISIQNQDYNNYEIIVVDNNSNDKTIEIVSLFKKVKCYRQPDIPGAGACKNYGVSKALGSIILFIDADEMIDDEFISVIIKPIISKKYFASVPYHKKGENDTVMFAEGIFRAIRKNKFKDFDITKGYADDKVDYLKGQIKKVEVPLYHLTSKSIKKSYFKGKWIGSSFLSNERNGYLSKLIYKFGYIIGLFKVINERKYIKLKDVTKLKNRLIDKLRDAVYLKQITALEFQLIDNFIRREFNFKVLKRNSLK